LTVIKTQFLLLSLFKKF